MVLVLFVVWLVLKANDGDVFAFGDSGIGCGVGYS